MTHQPMNAETTKYFDLDIHGIGYLNRVREIVPEKGNAFWSANIAALRGNADNVQHTYFDCVVVGEEAKDLVRQLQAFVDTDTKVLVGFHLSDLEAEPFLYTSGKRAGSMGVNVKSRLLRFHWIRVNGQPFLAPSAASRQTTV